MKFIAYTVKGLEEIVKKEVTLEIIDAKITEVADKLVVFESEKNFRELIRLRTVDDLGLFAAKFNFLDTASLTKEFEKIDLLHIRRSLKEFRELDDTFSLTIGSSKSAINTEKLKDRLSNLLIDKHNWEFTPTDHINFDIRVFISQKTAYISIRLTKESLHNRTYKIRSKEGSLRSTIAATMVYLSCGEKNNLKIVDDFCGSGTILCEAFLEGNQVFGGDINPESVQITQENLDHSNNHQIDNIRVLDATRTNWLESQFDVGISNLPWDKQIKTESITNLYIGTLKEYARIVKDKGIICLLVHKPELLIKYAKQYFPNAKIGTLKIGLLGQNPTIVLILNV